MELDINSKVEKIKTKDYHSIKFKSLVYFLLMALSLVTCVVFFEINFFEPIYQHIKTNDVKNVCSEVVANYETYQSKEAIAKIANTQEVDVLIFRVENNTAIIIYNGTREFDKNLLGKMNGIVDLLSKEKDKAVNYTYLENDTQTIATGIAKDINGTTIYFSVSTKLQPIKSTLRVLNISILFFLCGSVLIATILSITFSYIISSPIQKMSRTAKNIDKSHFDVKFDGSGYTEVEQLADTLNYAIGELKKTDELRNEVISNVSHELRTPLTMIKSYTELIKDINGDDKTKRDKNLNVILEETNRLEYLLNDMLDFSKLKSGIIEFNFEKFNLYSLLLKLQEFYTSQHENDGFTFKLKSPKTVFINADYKRIEQVIMNLLNNAINYSKENKEILIELKKLENDFYRLSITDHGIGISKENLPHIFDRHFRATNAKRVTVGSGIGLSIVKQILDAHKLEFGVISEENKGSTFYINFKAIAKQKGEPNE